MNYDRESGQVYSEEVIRVVPPVSKQRGFGRMGYEWAHESPFLPAGWEAYGPVGAHSLKHMAMRAVLSDQRTLSFSHFQGIPWLIAKYLWECLERSTKKSLYMWKIYATVYPKEFNEIARTYFLMPRTKKMPVSKYLKFISSASRDWLAVLSLSVEYFEPHDALEVANVPNLFGLELCSKPPRRQLGPGSGVSITDRDIKGWSEQALTGQAFGHLRILILRAQTSLTEHIFAYLDAFPSLKVFIMQGSPRLYSKEAMEMAAEHGWKPSTINTENSRLHKVIEGLGSKLEAQQQMDYQLHTINAGLVVHFALLVRDLRYDTHKEILFMRKHPPGTDHLSSQGGKRLKAHSCLDRDPSTPGLKKRKLTVKGIYQKDMKRLLDEFNQILLFDRIFLHFGLAGIA
ncbi:CBS domain-containing protein [Nannizzia gypsea CBS 118893]|uniref:CBS domain-containing protein n=1 Tax=Arthroderma gypseum (strain ATCC MYA-4604 / CBS 118893) TaxID=535722 RepID=E5R117_ARTGP|nr:CBS domain-containing protein [Nannizzia gypsea CBS 118893]EFQ97621.1 CBS domain-containing protein [Nannizzia gypsea CBS 118893]